MKSTADRTRVIALPLIVVVSLFAVAGCHHDGSPVQPVVEIPRTASAPTPPVTSTVVPSAVRVVP